MFQYIFILLLILNTYNLGNGFFKNNNKFSANIYNTKNKIKYDNINNFLNDNINNDIKNKKIITISPAGYRGFYLFGVAKYIKENYNLDNYIFTGASAGSWTSLFMIFNGDLNKLEEIILCKNISNIDNAIELQYSMKYKILTNFKDNNFNFKKLFIGVTGFKRFKLVTNIFYDFNSLEDSINCCIASSHIPFITTSGFSNKYNNMYSFDGGFSKYPYLNISIPVLHITPDMFKYINENKINNNLLYKIKKFIRKLNNLKEFTTLLTRNKYDFNELFMNGYNDAKNNKYLLDNIFLDNK